MTVRHAARLAGWVAIALAAAVAGAQVRLAGAAVALALVGALFVVLLLWLPRSAHAAFAAGRWAPASRRYWLAGAVTWSARRERACVLSRAGCAVAAEDHARAERLLAAVDPEGLDASERAVYWNNQAFAALAGAAADAHRALALADRALALRPDVPGIQHTRARALLAVGRVDDALHALDAMSHAGELPALLEAARCRDLAAAWEQKGEAAYADDYRRRAAGIAGVTGVTSVR